MNNNKIDLHTMCNDLQLDQALLIPCMGSDGSDTIRVSLTYSKGGVNVWSGREEPRGYNLSATPCAISVAGGVRYMSVTLGAGLRAHVHTVTRRGKTADAIATAKARDIAVGMVLRVADAYGLQIGGAVNA